MIPAYDISNTDTNLGQHCSVRPPLDDGLESYSTEEARASKPLGVLDVMMSETKYHSI